ncbi:hypothetical protein SAMN06298211_1205 [Prevotellaceae bacterium MN60]|nr:hypothetical protein SAMN06298211_1205 [Prevotellaceae bacterium MN60]
MRIPKHLYGEFYLHEKRKHDARPVTMRYDGWKMLERAQSRCVKGWGQIVTPLSIQTAGGKQRVNCNTWGQSRCAQSRCAQNLFFHYFFTMI